MRPIAPFSTPRRGCPRGVGGARRIAASPVVPTVFFFVAMLVVAPATSAQTVADVVFLPQTYYVGDRVEARVVLDIDSASEITIPDELPRTDWITIESITTLQRSDGVELRIVFQPFFVGTRELPPIDLEQTLLTGVTAFVTSVGGDGEELRTAPVRDQILLPGTEVRIALFAIVLFGVPPTVFFLSGWGRRRLGRVRRWYRERRPYRGFVKSARRLAGRVNELDGKTFYTHLLNLCREYLDGRFSAGLRSATTGELESVLERAGIPATERRRLRLLFEFGDLVKFAGRRATLEERSAHVEEARDIVLALQRGESQHSPSTYPPSTHSPSTYPPSAYPPSTDQGGRRVDS